MADMRIRKVNECKLRVTFKESCHAWDMSAFFEFEVNGARFHPQYKNKMWDGKKRLYNVMSGEIDVGLLFYVLKFAQINKLTVDREANLLSVVNPVPPQKTVNFIKTLNLPFAPYDYQAKALHTMINGRRRLVISPTSSGKSLIIYMTLRFWERILPADKKILIIVPTTSLVKQMVGDFKDYSSQNGWNVSGNCHMIFDGTTKHTNKKVVVSTWQSIYRMRKKYFQQFGAIVGDEAHNFKASSLLSIMNKLPHVPYRIGTTGTVGDEQVNRLTLEGLFGPQHRTITTRELMDRGLCADLTIKAIQLQYRDHHLLREMSSAAYQTEEAWITKHTRRNKFLAKLAVAQEKNTLILYEKINHGKAIKAEVEKLVANDPSRKVYFFNGDVDVNEREAARPEIEAMDGAIIIASLGVFSTGVNIKNIHSVIFAWIGKSSIRVLQSIGRGLRISKTKTKVTLYDVFDNMKYQGRRNYTLKHFINRMDIYKSEQFKVETQTVNF